MAVQLDSNVSLETHSPSRRGRGGESGQGFGEDSCKDFSRARAKAALPRCRTLIAEGRRAIFSG